LIVNTYFSPKKIQNNAQDISSVILSKTSKHQYLRQIITDGPEIINLKNSIIYYYMIILY